MASGHARALVCAMAIAMAGACASCSTRYSAAEPGGTDSSTSAQSPWDCYGPQPGHPTSAEQTAFVESNADAAQTAERTYGVPAAAILAMATNEGGYGFTRTALNANNTFGYKWGSSAAAGGRASYELTCQPASDPGNLYIVFSDFRDGFLFVSQKLATRADYANYKAATDRYQADRAAGVEVITAVNTWIDGIADAGYNYDPSTYKRTLRAHANNYLMPGPSYSATYNLYKYSAAIAYGTPAPPPPPASSGPPDPPPPLPNASVSIATPAAGAQVSGDVALEASTVGQVTLVRFSSRAVGDPDPFYVIKDVQAPPYAITWATKGWVANGSYELRVEAWNGGTMLGTETIQVAVVN